QIGENSVDLDGALPIARKVVLPANQLLGFRECGITSIDVEATIVQQALLNRQSDQTPTKRAMNGGETRCCDLLKYRHDEAKRAALVAALLGEGEAIHQV